MKEDLDVLKGYEEYIYSKTTCKSGPCKCVWVIKFNNNLGLILRLMQNSGDDPGFYFGLTGIYFDKDDDHYFDTCTEINDLIPHYLKQPNEVHDVMLDIKHRKEYIRKWKLLIN